MVVVCGVVDYYSYVVQYCNQCDLELVGVQEIKDVYGVFFVDGICVFCVLFELYWIYYVVCVVLVSNIVQVLVGSCDCL